MEPWAKRNERAEKAVAEARKAAEAYEKILRGLADAKKERNKRQHDAQKPLQVREEAHEAVLEAATLETIAEMRLLGCRNELDEALEQLEEVQAAAAGGPPPDARRRRSGGNRAPHAGAAPNVAAPAPPITVAEAEKLVEAARAKFETAERTHDEAKAVLAQVKHAFEAAEADAKVAEDAVAEVDEDIRELEEERAGAAIHAWETQREAAVLAEALGHNPVPRKFDVAREPPPFLRITSATTTLEASVERSLRALQSSNEAFQPAKSAKGAEELIRTYALAGSMQKVTDHLNRLKLTPVRRKVLALTYAATLVAVIEEIEEELAPGVAIDRDHPGVRRIMRERIDDLAGFSNTILDYQAENVYPLLADRVVDDVRRVRRLSIPDAGPARRLVVDRVTARL